MKNWALIAGALWLGACGSSGGSPPDGGASSKADGGTGSTGGGGASKPKTVGEEPCTTCVVNACPTQTNACKADAACKAVYDCHFACPLTATGEEDQNCSDKCDAMAGANGIPWDNLNNCFAGKVTSSCASQCAADSDAGMGGVMGGGNSGTNGSSSGGTTGSGGGSACQSTNGQDACQDCLSAKCCTQITACTSSPCGALVQCIGDKCATITDQNAFQMCVQQNCSTQSTQQAVTGLNAVVDCQDMNCATECQ